MENRDPLDIAKPPLNDAQYSDILATNETTISPTIFMP